MQALQKAHSYGSQIGPVQGPTLSPRVFAPPYGGGGYYQQSYRWREVLAYKYWVFVAINAWVRTIAGGEPINLGEIRNRADRQKVKRKALGGPKAHHEFEPWPDEHPIVQTFQRPNHYDVSYDLWAYTIMFYLLTGEAHWWVMRDRLGIPREIWVIPSHWLRLMAGYDGNPETYWVQSPWGASVQIPFNEVISFYWHSPLNRFEGYGAAIGVSEWIDRCDAAVRSELAQFINGAVPQFHVQLSDVYGDPSEEFLRRFYNKWLSRFQGPNKTGMPIITGSGVDIKSLGISPMDMGYEQQDTRACKNILAAFGVPPAVTGLEPSRDANSYSDQNQFCVFTVNPVLHYFSQVITHKILRPRYDHGIAYWDDRTRNDPAQMLAEQQFCLQNGIKTPNEIRTDDYGMERFPNGGEDPILNGAPVPWMTGKGEDPVMEQAFHRSRQQALMASNGTMGGFLEAKRDFMKKNGVLN